MPVHTSSLPDLNLSPGELLAIESCSCQTPEQIVSIGLEELDRRIDSWWKQQHASSPSCPQRVPSSDRLREIADAAAALVARSVAKASQDRSLAWLISNPPPPEILAQLPLAAPAESSLPNHPASASPAASGPAPSLATFEPHAQSQSKSRISASPVHKNNITVISAASAQGASRHHPHSLPSAHPLPSAHQPSPHHSPPLACNSILDATTTPLKPGDFQEKPVWKRQGITHTTPHKTRTIAVLTLSCALLAALSLGSAGYLCLLSFNGSPAEWIYIIPVAVLALFSLAYLAFVSSARCSVCKQPVFFPKRCTKNRRAHHIPGLGHHIPTAMVVLSFGWFRCPYCGTAQRLDKRENSSHTP